MPNLFVAALSFQALVSPQEGGLWKDRYHEADLLLLNREMQPCVRFMGLLQVHLSGPCVVLGLYIYQTLPNSEGFKSRIASSVNNMTTTVMLIC